MPFYLSLIFLFFVHWLHTVKHLTRAGRMCMRYIFRVCVASFPFASFASFTSFAHPTGMHSVDAMGEDTIVLKMIRMRNMQMMRTQKTRCRCKRHDADTNFPVHILKCLSNQKTDSSPHSIHPCRQTRDATVFQGSTQSSGKMALRQVRKDAQMQTLSRQPSSASSFIYCRA